MAYSSDRRLNGTHTEEGACRLGQDATVQRGSSDGHNGRLDEEDALHMCICACNLPEDVLSMCTARHLHINGRGLRNVPRRP